MKFSEKVGNGTMNRCLNVIGSPDHRLDTGIVFQIRHYWKLKKVVNGHKSAAHTDSPDGGTGKTCIAEVFTDPLVLVVIYIFVCQFCDSLMFLVHSQVTIIFVVSVCLSVCLCRVCLSRL